MSQTPESKPKDTPETYFQFPLSALSYRLDSDYRWTRLVLYCCCEYGRKAWEATPDFVFNETIDTYLQSHPELDWIDLSHFGHQCVVFGLSRLGVDLPLDMDHDFNDVIALSVYFDEYRTPLVRLRTDLFLKTFAPKPTDNAISFREFRVVCAVYGGIGSKPFAKLCHQQLIRYAAGYPQPGIFESIRSRGLGKDTILSRKQIRLSLDRLEANRFFAKYTFLRGECFYSHRLSKEELQKAVGAMKLRRSATIYDSRKSDKTASEEIRQLRKQMRSPWKDEQK